jgi:serine/threonine protein kinase
MPEFSLIGGNCPENGTDKSPPPLTSQFTTADPIQFPNPSLHQCIMARVPVRTGKNMVETKVIMETDTGNFYETGRKLRETIFGMVIHAIQLARAEDGHLFRKQPISSLAIKIYYRVRLHAYRGKTQENPNTEIAAMQFLGKHPNIMSQIDCCSDKDNVYSIMDFSDGGELYDYIDQEGPIAEERARDFFTQILQGLTHLHNAGISHRDLTLENVMLSRDGTCKLIDFGMSLRLPRVTKDECFADQGANNDRSRPVLMIPPQGTCGKPNYIAPEVMENTKDFNPQLSDVWSLGVMLFITLTGVPPVAVAYDLDDRYRLICDGGLQTMLIQWDFHLSSEAVDLLHNLLRPNPADRLTLKEISNHPWVNDKAEVILQ